MEKEMIKWSRVSELREEVGADDFDEVVELFLEEVEERIAILDSAKSVQETQEDLHFLKGSALNLGFSAFASLCQEGENSSEVAKSAENLLEVKAVFSRSKIAFLSQIAREETV